MADEKIIHISIEEEMKTAYIDYAMSVIVSRALPDVRDGLKPVHRRVLFGMSELGLDYNKPYKKSARIVGEVLGKYHPHGDGSVYDTMVRMAQDWSLRYPLVEGQGNFGSMDGDSPAAMRYTEARLSRIADTMLLDIDKETVDFTLNFDDSLEEPSVLPARLPNLLVNGATGIAVGMATNMLPHNITEVIDGINAYVDNESITLPELMKYIKGPDMPTGGIIYGVEGIKEAYATGRGKVVVRGRADIQMQGNKEVIIISEIPYQVNKSILVSKIAELVNEKKIIGISNIKDESDRNGLRIVIDIKKDAIASVVLSSLYKMTPLQTSYGINNVALVNGRPYTLNLYQLIKEFVKFRIEIIVKRTKYELKKAEERAHILEGLLIALDHLDEIINLIRASQTPEEAKEGLISSFQLSEIQAKAILDMRLQRLTGLERDKIRLEYDEIMNQIARYKEILASEKEQRNILKAELAELKEKFGDERRTEITFVDSEISMQDLIAEEDVVVTISHMGYIKRTPVTEYRIQSRGGKGSRGAKTRDADFVEHMFIASTHATLLLFTNSGKCHWLKVYELPEATKTSAGRAIQNILALPQNEKIRAYINVKDLNNKEFLESHYIVLCTQQGVIKKSSLDLFCRPRAGGIAAINIQEGDQLLDAKLTSGNLEILIASKSGKAIRFNESKVRPMGRTAGGVAGMSLEENDQVVGMICVDPQDKSQSILVVSEKGYGKRSELEDYRVTNRGGKGVRTILVTDKTGTLVAIKTVSDPDDLMITNTGGIVIRMSASDLRIMGRATQGVRLIRLEEGDEIADVAVVRNDESVEEGEEIEDPKV